jgi:predicted signal transduction protein with EAL and GGDEF domain
MSPRTSIIRILLLTIFHTLAWVFAMFLTDSMWGDAVSRALVAPFLAANTVLAIFLLFTFRSAGHWPSE